MEQIKSISIFVVILPFLFGFAEVPQNAPVSDGVSDVGNTTTTVEKPPDVPFYGQETIVIEPDRKVLTNDSTVEDIIKYWSDEYDNSYQKAYFLAKCESQLDPKAANPKSSARGLYQFLTYDSPSVTSTWTAECEGDVFSAIHNSQCAIRMLSEGGESNWLADPGIPLCLSKLGITL